MSAPRKINYFLLALSVYLPTLFFVPHMFFVFTFSLYFLYFNKIYIEKYDYIIFIAVMIMLLNILSSVPSVDLDKHLSSFATPLIIAVMLYSRIINKNFAKWLIIFTLIESVVVIYEFISGQQYIFAAQTHGIDINTIDYSLSDMGNVILYQIRPLGLSSNSSSVAYKFFIGLLLFMEYYSNISIKYIVIVILLLALGMILTFNRSTIIASLSFSLLIYINNYFHQERKNKLLYLFVSLSIVLAAIWYKDEINELYYIQFSRGMDLMTNIDTGRAAIWRSGLEFLKSNLFFGNNSLTFTISSDITYDAVGHVHNSFLAMLGRNGIIISTLFFMYIILSVNRYNYIYILPICIYSSLQYGIFWNVSYTDLIFYHYLAKGRWPPIIQSLPPKMSWSGNFGHPDTG